jgi:hypothetical protein
MSDAEKGRVAYTGKAEPHSMVEALLKFENGNTTAVIVADADRQYQLRGSER